MRIDDRRLTFLALVALDEVLDGGPVTQGLRFALAYLYDASDLDRRWFDQFWQAARAFNGDAGSAEGFGRVQTMTASMNAICRSVGMERDVELMARLSKARGIDTSPPYPKRPTNSHPGSD